MSYIKRYITTDGSARLIFSDSRDIVNRAIEIHGTTPLAAAALGRTLTATSIMGSLMKNKDDKLTVIINGDGPAGRITCIGDYMGNVRGYMQNPLVELPLREDGKLNVGKAVGHGTLHVIRDLGLNEPYIGMSPLVSGEIAEHITSYSASSDQTPSVTALGVLIDVDYTCKAAGGFLIQVLPGADDEVIDKIEKNMAMFPAVTSLLSSGKTADDISALAFRDIPFELFDTIDNGYVCDCSRERYKKALVGLGKRELEDMISENKPIETRCQLCGATYTFECSELAEILSQAENKE